MYNKDLKCTYHFYDKKLREILPENELTSEIMENVEDNEDFADILYKAELLQVFHLNDINDTDDTELLNKIQKLYETVCIDETFQMSSLKSANRFFSQDPTYGFMIMFNYHSFFIILRCLSDFFERGKVSLENKKILMETLEIKD